MDSWVFETEMCAVDRFTVTEYTEIDRKQSVGSISL